MQVRHRQLLRRILIGANVFVFAAAGVPKLLALRFEVDAFENWGYPLWMLYVVGAAEVAGAIGVAVGRTRLLALAGLAVIMAGAIYTHVQAGEAYLAAVPGLVLVSQAIVARLELSAADDSGPTG